MSDGVAVHLTERECMDAMFALHEVEKRLRRQGVEGMADRHDDLAEKLVLALDDAISGDESQRPPG